MVTPTLLDLKRLNLLDGAGKFCGTGANYDLIKAELAQFRLSHNAVNPTAQANRVVGVIDPAVGLGPPMPCFEGMAVVNSQEAWALARPGRAGQLLGLEIAHTLGLTPPSRESPFDGAHSQNVAAENPSVNRRYNVVQRGFIVSDRSLLKPSGTSPSPDNVNTLLEVPDYAFLLCVFGGTANSECTTHGPGTVNANAPVAATLSFVMSGTTTSENPGGICATCTGAGAGTSVVESYFASTVPQTSPSPSSTYRLVQRNVGGGVISNQGVPVAFLHSGHSHDSPSETHHSGLFSFALPFESTTDRIELWKGTPGASGSLILFARERTDPPVVTDMTVGGSILLRAGTRSRRSFGSRIAGPLSWSPTGMELLSPSSTGGNANGNSGHVGGTVSISANGRYVAFTSDASNLVSGDANGVSDVFLFDRQTDTTERVSITDGEAEANGQSSAPFVSADGRYVGFSSAATNLVTGDTNGAFDSFLRDRQAGTTERVSVSSAEAEADFNSSWSSMSADGRYVLFASSATNLVAGDTNSQIDMFVRDRTAGTTERASVADNEAQANDSSQIGTISADGRFAAFESDATNLVPGGTASTDVYVRDLVNDTTERVSVSSTEVAGDDLSRAPSLSSDGRYVVFVSRAANFDAGDTNSNDDIYLRDRTAGTTERISVATGGGSANAQSSAFTRNGVSDDGRYVAFDSFATNLVPGDANVAGDIFVRDLSDDTTTRINIPGPGQQANNGSVNSVISADGQVVAFSSVASNLASGDENGFWDVFATDQGAAAGSVLIVNTENDVTDGACNATHCSLREAINASNASAGTADAITFDIPPNGFPSIDLASGLPTITDPVTIDATTQDSETDDARRRTCTGATSTGRRTVST